MRPVAAAHSLDYPPRDVRRGKFRQQGGLGNAEQRGRRVCALAFCKLQCRDPLRPCSQYPGQSAGHEVRVNGLRRIEAERTTYLDRLDKLRSRGRNVGWAVEEEFNSHEIRGIVKPNWSVG